MLGLGFWPKIVVHVISIASISCVSLIQEPEFFRHQYICDRHLSAAPPNSTIPYRALSSYNACTSVATSADASTYYAGARGGNLQDQLNGT
ncbi:hypothetical protein V1520DRAFT_391673 [Lipomyces starkeyi]|uniref:Secreted protein n=1 Tax=Lipomyces starkeyi NRRL Y-11557 TaxID=675824 RepID=A0A1E3QFU8_LIPST|nr:hypothetical protein LIPSTDRAFT_138237 [Lipomyces starkeyi NRRL Y-11557]